ncbi:AsnC family protein [Arthrobacter sp. VKM Ac-2550]|uniref:AsnC family protein n=1 Tax=Crystallibacter permensis TaxID=1938888 RepID=UPI002226A5F3|nr:AsnC family protein [Arthrobacter sp. VKM Ac-2550]
MIDATKSSTYPDGMASKTGLSQAEGGDPLQELGAIRKARLQMERQEHYWVLQARNADVSWAAIAAVLGVSKQAAHQKFRKRPAE